MEKYVAADESQKLVNLEKSDPGSRSKLLAYMFFLILAILIPFILTDAYVRHLLVLTVIFSTLALSLDVILGHMGQFSFGHQAFFGLGGYVSGILTTELGFPAWAGFFTGIAASAFLGLLVGLVALRRARGFFLGIITLGVGKVVWLVPSDGRSHRRTLGSRYSAFDASRSLLGGITFDSELRLLLNIIIGAHHLCIYVWMGSRFRKPSHRPGERTACDSIGVNPHECYVWSFTFACALAGLAGAMYAHYIAIIVPPSQHGVHFWMLVMVNGRMRTFAGPITGAAIFVFLRNSSWP
jgi:branched-chain amino acid transport system permease protein